jgi:hypothetical protein
LVVIFGFYKGGGQLEVPEMRESGFLLRPTEQAVAAIQRCFHKEIFLLPLADRFFKLALQIGKHSPSRAGYGCHTALLPQGDLPPPSSRQILQACSPDR